MPVRSADPPRTSRPASSHSANSRSAIALPLGRRALLGAVLGTGSLGVAVPAAVALSEAGGVPGGQAGHGAHGGHAAHAPGRPAGADLMCAEEWDGQGIDAHAMLTDWDTGEVSRAPAGRRVREFFITAQEKVIEIAPGVLFPAWTYNGRVPGPSIRVTEGDRVRIHFTNRTCMLHTMHFHGIHGWRMDGTPGVGEPAPGESVVYEFDAHPFGCHLYHCHSLPLAPHIFRGLYGAFVIDPDPERHPDHAAAARSRLLGTEENAKWQEMMMIMNGFDTNDDGENEVYAVNTVADVYHRKPIPVDGRRPIRIYLGNMTEFDLINSFHTHANFFDYYDTGTTLTPTLRTVDTVIQCQGQRGILEMSYALHEPGPYMFHAHQAEFAEKGWMSLFDVRG